jgi:hypothetical protein
VGAAYIKLADEPIVKTIDATADIRSTSTGSGLWSAWKC